MVKTKAIKKVLRLLGRVKCKNDLPDIMHVKLAVPAGNFIIMLGTRGPIYVTADRIDGAISGYSWTALTLAYGFLELGIITDSERSEFDDWFRNQEDLDSRRREIEELHRRANQAGFVLKKME